MKIRQLENWFLLFFGTMFAMVLFLWIVSFSVVSAEETGLVIEEAKWKEEKSILAVKGTSFRESTILILDTGTGDLLGETVSDSEGQWRLRIRNPESVPCRLTARTEDQKFEKDIENAPAGCYGPPFPALDGSHAGRFTAFEGTKTCLECHRTEALQIHESVHYQWKGDAREAIGLNSWEAGKLGGINDFCIYPDINWIGKLTNVEGVNVDGGCAKCHAGLGEKPDPIATEGQLENIDCLICHSDRYKRTVAMVDGNYRFVPDTDKMSVSLLEAATDIGRPSRDACLNCHTKSGGGNNYKRGDIEEAHRNPSRAFDVHMATRERGGAGLSCLDCHTSRDHKIAGRGTDLRPRDLDEEVSCARCHTNSPHGERDIDKHTARVNCTVCHIPAFARAAPTDMLRDWSLPGELDPARGLYEPSHVKGTGVIPEYRFFNGKSHFYQFGDPVMAGENGRVVMSSPDGNILDPGAKIHAFKHHLAIQPVDPYTGRLLPLKIGKFFMTGEVGPAIKSGAEAVGWGYDGHEYVETERYMGIFHEVAPKENALSCTDCHGAGGRMDFATLGYDPRNTRNGNPLCISCHSDKPNDWSGSKYFKNVHEKHVEDKRYDCSVCHYFSSAN